MLRRSLGLAVRLLTGLTMLVGVPAFGVAQTQPPSLRSKVVLVPLDVRVVDGDGNPVTDLKETDFTVYENGIVQKISHFLAVPLAINREKQHLELADDHPLASATSSHRTFIFVLGRGNLNGPVKGIDAVINFVRERLVPNDRVGLNAYLRTSDPTNDHQAVVRFLERYRNIHEDLEARVVADRRGNRGSYPTFSKETSARIQALFATSDIPEFRELPGAEGNVYHRYETANYLRWTIQAARRIPGEKHVIVLAEDGLPLARIHEKPEDNPIVKWANEARVAVSYINTGGLAGDFMRKGKLFIPKTFAHRSLNEFFEPTDHRLLADQTGGTATFYRYASVGLDKLDRASKFQYLLGYYPALTSAPEVPRTIRIVVSRPNVTAYYRHGYRLASSPHDEKEFKAAIIDDRLDAELVRVMDPSTQKTQLRNARLTPSLKIETALGPRAGSTGEVRVSLSLDPARMWFEGAESAKNAVLHAAILIEDAQGTRVGELRRPIEIALAAKEFAQTKKHWLEFDVMVPVKGEPARIRAALYNYEAGSMFSAAAPIRDR